MIAIILGGILSGVFTATESAATAVLWALLVTDIVYRSLSWEHFMKACAKASLLMVTFVPAFSLWLPKLLLGA